MLIKMKDYERTFQIISAVIESEGRNPAFSCIEYSIFGACILINHFKVDAKIQCGLATYHLGGENDVLCFGEQQSKGIRATEDKFHCWIEANGWYLDFMAPKFNELIKSNNILKPKMFQKKIQEVKQKPNEMKQFGDFFFCHHDKLARDILSPLLSHAGMQDLAHHCSQWFQKYPKKIPVQMATVDQDGIMRPIQLKSIVLNSKF